MRQPFRPTNGRANGPNNPQMLAASHAPVTERGTAGYVGSSAPSKAAPPELVPATNPVPVTAAEAQERARATRDERQRKPTGPHRLIRAADIPSVPPAPSPPARLTPVVLVLVQTLLDVLVTSAAFSVAYVLRFSQTDQTVATPDTPTYAMLLAVTVTTIVVTFYFSKLYGLKRGASRVDEFYKIAAAVSMGTVLSIATSSLLLGDVFNYSRQVLLTGWVLTIIFVTAQRISYSVVLGELRKRGLDRSRVLIVGAGPIAQVVEERLRYHRTLGYQVVGMVESTNADHIASSSSTSSRSRVPVLGTLPNLNQLVRKYNVDEVIVALSGASDKQLREVLGLLQDESVSVKIYPDAFQLMTQNEVSVGELSGLPLLSVKDVALRGWNRRFKRSFDLVFSFIVLILTSPFILIIALAVRFSSPGPVFFIQERVGLDGVPFQLVKFRTMKIPASIGDTPVVNDGMPGWTVRNDPRRTAIGSFLRRFSLDELPQFYNVLVGEMSIVGPRPEQPAYVQEFAQRIPRYLYRHREKAGITGWAQVNGWRGDSSIELRTAADLYYVENWSVLLDFKIIVRTVVAMFRGKNAY